MKSLQLASRAPTPLQIPVTVCALLVNVHLGVLADPYFIFMCQARDPIVVADRASGYIFFVGDLNRPHMDSGSDGKEVVARLLSESQGEVESGNYTVEEGKQSVSKRLDHPAVELTDQALALSIVGDHEAAHVLVAELPSQAG